MTTVLWLLGVQGALGAFDTLYYHEWRARLPSLRPEGRLELWLHAARDFIYAVLFATLPWIAWRGGWAAALGLLILAEIVITIADFTLEDRVRLPLGGVFPGERATHTIMAIVYGAMLGNLVPEGVRWWNEGTGLSLNPVGAPLLLKGALAAMGLGVLLSGIRDAAAAWRMRVTSPRG